MIGWEGETLVKVETRVFKGHKMELEGPRIPLNRSRLNLRKIPRQPCGDSTFTGFG